MGRSARQALPAAGWPTLAGRNSSSVSKPRLGWKKAWPNLWTGGAGSEQRVRCGPLSQSADLDDQTGNLPDIPVMRPWLGQEEASAAAAAVTSGWVAQGPRVAEFEKELANRVAAGHGAAGASCPRAL